MGGCETFRAQSKKQRLKQLVYISICLTGSRYILTSKNGLRKNLVFLRVRWHFGEVFAYPRLVTDFCVPSYVW